MSGRRFLPDRIRESLGTAAGDGARDRDATGNDGTSTGREPPTGVSRRDFLRWSGVAGGSLLLAVHLPGCGGGEPVTSGEGSGDGFRPDVWVRLDPDGAATVTVAKSEMGQGVRTTLALIVAEEMDLDWDRVEVAQAPADEEAYGDQGTGGSASVRSSWEKLRRAGARARAGLVAAAAEELGVAAGELETRAGTVLDPASGREIGYGDLAAAAAKRPLPDDAPLKNPSEWRLLGREHVGVDVDDILSGRPVYGSDVRREGMFFAAVARTPAHGGGVRSYDASAARETPGVRQIFELEGVGGGTNVHPGVAVVAENSWAAIRGRDALEVDWKPGPHGNDDSGGFSRRMRDAVDRTGDALVNRVGDPDGVIAGAGQVRSATYEVPFISHATMEPQNTLAEVTGDRAVLRSPTQFPNWAARATASALDIPRENVELTIPLLGGGYGRRINPDYAVEAALVAREVDGPVQVLWTREDDMRHDFYRPAAVHRIDVVVGEDGYPEAWRQRLCTPAISGTYEEDVDAEAFGAEESTGAADMLYRVPNRSCEYSYLPCGLTRGWWRAVHTTHTTFAVECFLDELAEAAEIDPVEYRLALIGEPQVDRPSPPEEFPFEPERLKGVLRAVADAADWGRAVPEDRGLGVACGIDHLSYSAEVVEVSVSGDRLRVEKVWCAADCGPVLNPNGARAQIEGAITQGLSAALRERLTVSGGAIQEGNFDEYPILRIDEAPREIDVDFVETDTHPTGLGEPGLPPAAPALANAVYAATGRRLRTLPLDV